MSFLSMDSAMKAEVGSSAERLVLVTLAFFRNDECGLCFPSITAIAEAACMNEKTVQAALARLEARGLIKRAHGRAPNGQRCNYYTLHMAETGTTKTGCTAENGTTENGGTTEIGSTQIFQKVPPKTDNKQGKEQGIVVRDSARAAPRSVPHKFNLTEIPPQWADYCRKKKPALDPQAVFDDFAAYFTFGKGCDERRSDKSWATSFQGWVRRQDDARPPARMAAPTPAFSRRDIEVQQGAQLILSGVGRNPEEQALATFLQETFHARQ